jgi:hypothetical protein
MMSMILAICELGEYNLSQKKEFVNNPCPFYKNHHNGSIHFYIPFINNFLTECLLFYLLYFKMKNWNNQLHIYFMLVKQKQC